MGSLLALLTAWLPQQRWYSSAHRSPALEIATLVTLSRTPDADVAMAIVVDRSVTPPVTYHVPLVVRTGAEHPADVAHLIGTLDDGRQVWDGPHDAAYARLVYDVVTGRGSAQHDSGVTGHPATDHASGPAVDVAAHVLGGEQSNTSLVFSPDGVAPIICKVYRQLHEGIHPDIEVQVALAGLGFAHVAPAVGWVEATWPEAEGEHVQGAIAFATEFLPGVEDAWRVASEVAECGRDFTGPARELGATIAQTHDALRRAFGTSPASQAARDAAVSAWMRRLDIATREVPGVAAHREAIAAVYASAAESEWPSLQRIHGDLHLGQVLQSPARGWVVIDFEGEPMRPMPERREPDLALRDVAGMLRSFDYVAGSLGVRPGMDAAATAAAVAWANASRDAFVSGYDAVVGGDSAGVLRDALELDKAVYETIYEARNRPSWVPIPLAAVARLIGEPGVA